MKFEKPKLVAMDTAFKAIQGLLTKDLYQSDFVVYGTPNDFRPTTPAYEADE